MHSASPKSNGFTLLEILVVTSIMAILFFTGFAGYRDFSRRQQLSVLAKQLQTDMQFAQAQALSGAKPSGAACASPNRLDGWGIVAAGDELSYSIYARCSNAAGVGTSVTDANRIRILPTGYTIARTYNPPHIPVFTYFKVLGNGTFIPSGFDAIFTITDPSGATTVVTMTSSGEIK